MTKPSAYVVQFIATFMIIGGGVAIAGDMVVGAHCLMGWLSVVCGILFLIVGARQRVKTKKGQP